MFENRLLFFVLVRVLMIGVSLISIIIELGVKL